MKRSLKLKNVVKQVALGSLILIAFVGCKKSEKAIDPSLMLGVEDTREVSSSASDYSVDVVSNLPWTAASDVDWITFPTESGEKGKSALKFSVTKNEGDERIATVTVSTSSNYQKQFTVIQESGLSSDMYVKVDGTGEGKSWSDATTLSKALELAPSGSTIFIATGTHTPTKTITGGEASDDRDITFEINRYVTLQGGYPANATTGASADPKVNKTLLSGNLPSGNQTYHVVTVTAPALEGQKVVIDGLTISHGNGYDRGSILTIGGVGFARGNGGGMSIGNAIVDIINTDIVDNETSGAGNAAGYAAGVFAFGGSLVTIENSKINDNSSSGNGGGLWVDRSTAYIYNSEFNRNSSGTAAGVHGYPDAKIYMYNSTVADNRGRSYGAGFYIRQNSLGVLVNCLITGNESTAVNGGGGIMMYNNNEVAVISSTITKNSIPGPGGGVFRESNTNKLSVYNSIISGNTSKDGGPDIDAKGVAVDPVLQSSVIGVKAYNPSGGEIAGTSFDFNTMLNTGFVPVGANNPALIHGMSGAALTTLGETFSPALKSFVSSDFNGKSRSSSTVMGALVE